MIVGGIIVAVVAVMAVIGIMSFKKRVSRGCCSPSDDSVEKVKIADANPADYPYEKTVHIEGMHCSNCVTRVQNAYEEKGCLAEVSLGKKEAHVYMKTPLSDAKLAAIPARLGYDAKVE